MAVDAMIVDAMIVDAPPACSAADLGVAGERQTPRRLVTAECRLRWDRIEDVVTMARMAAAGLRDLAGKPIAPPPERVAYDPRNVGPAAIELSSAASFDRFVMCPHGVYLHWSREHVWLVAFSAENGYMNVESVIDDGRRATLGVAAGRGKSCGDAAPPNNRLFELVVVPRERDVLLRSCRNTYVDLCPGYP
jgi:hypothetical protein